MHNFSCSNKMYGQLQGSWAKGHLNTVAIVTSVPSALYTYSIHVLNSMEFF